MIFAPRRLVLYAAAFAFTLAGTRSIMSQVPQRSLTSLPDAPVRQPVSATLLAENVSTSAYPGQATQTQTPPPPTPIQMTDAEKKRAAEEELQRELHQRIGGVVPNFKAVLDGSSVPLSPRQKMRAAFRSAIDPYQFGLALFTSGIGQAEDSHHGYGQGMQGYGKRLGANFTDQFDGTILGNGVFPVLLRQDARYYRLGTGSFKKRFFYSLITTVRCKGDNGKWQPNYSNLLGNLAAGGISNLYYPEDDRGFKLTIEQGITVTGEGAFGALLIEFYPDIKKHVFHKQ